MTSNSEKLKERIRVCEEQTRTCVTARRLECQQARALCQCRGTRPSLAPARLSVVCSLLLFSLLPFFRAGFRGVVLKQEVRSSHFGHPRGEAGRWNHRHSFGDTDSVDQQENPAEASQTLGPFEVGPPLWSQLPLGMGGDDQLASSTTRTAAISDEF